MKQELINHLKTKHINDVTALWCETKSYYNKKLIEMGGGYVSFGKSIYVKLSINDKIHSFRVSISECS